MVLDLKTGSALVTEGGTSKEGSMQIEIIKQTMAAKKPVKVGDVITVPEAEGRLLIHLKRAIKHEGKEPEPKVAEVKDAGKAEVTKAAEVTEADKAEVAEANKDSAKAEFVVPSKQKPKKKK